MLSALVYKALPSISTEKDFSALINLLNKAISQKKTLKIRQLAILSILNESNGNIRMAVFKEFKGHTDKSKL